MFGVVLIVMVLVLFWLIKEAFVLVFNYDIEASKKMAQDIAKAYEQHILEVSLRGQSEE